jgi:hypothetical protein
VIQRILRQLAQQTAHRETFARGSRPWGPLERILPNGKYLEKNTLSTERGGRAPARKKKKRGGGGGVGQKFGRVRKKEKKKFLLYNKNLPRVARTLVFI